MLNRPAVTSAITETVLLTGQTRLARPPLGERLLLLPSWMPEEKSEPGAQQLISVPVVRDRQTLVSLPPDGERNPDQPSARPLR